MKTKIICSILIISMGFIACKKESAATKTNQEKLLGKWNLVSTVVNDYYNGASHVNSTLWPAGDYIDFRSNGKAYGHNSGSHDTATYGFVNDNKLWIDDPGYVYDIKILTESDLQLYRKDIFSATEYSEATATARK